MLGNSCQTNPRKSISLSGLRFYCDVCDYSALAKATVKEHKKVDINSTYCNFSNILV